MAASGTLTTNEVEGRSITLTWTQTKNVATNKSTIAWTLKGSGSLGGGNYVVSGNFKVRINGTDVWSSATRINLKKDQVIKTGSTTVTHNSDGSKSVEFHIEAGIYTTAVSATATKTWALDIIPRASSVKATNANIGAKSTITITRHSSSFTHTLTYSYSGLTGTIATKTASTSVTWTIPSTFYAKIPNATKTGNITITCTTYNGSTQIGSATSCTIVATTNSTDCVPKISTLTARNTTHQTLVKSNQRFIKGFDNVLFSFTANSRNSATISKYVITAVGTTKSVTETGLSGTTLSRTDKPIALPTVNNFLLTVTDSRGYTASKTITLSDGIVNYFKPTISISNKNFDSQGTVTCKISGTVMNNYFDSGRTVPNVGSLKIKFGSSAETTVTPTVSGNNYTYNFSTTVADINATYKLTVTGQDLLSSVSTSTSFTRIPTFDWSPTDFNFNVPVKYTQITNNSSSSYSISGVAKAYSTAIDFSRVTGTPSAGQYKVVWGTSSTTGNWSSKDPSSGTDYPPVIYLTGNMLFVSLRGYCTKAIAAGNISNILVATFTINPGQKIANIVNVGGNADGTGPICSWYLSSTLDDSTGVVTMNVYLAAVGTAVSANGCVTCRTIVPTRLNLSKY